MKAAIAAKISRAKRLYAQAYELMDEATADAAREILRRFPIAREYVQAMGSRSFKVVVRLPDSSTEDLDLETRSWLEDEGDGMVREDLRQVAPLREAVDRFYREVADEAGELFGGSMSPMRLTATGPVVRDW